MPRNINYDGLADLPDPVEGFSSTLLSSANITIPKTSSTPKIHSKPWFDDECKMAVLERKKALVSQTNPANLTSLRVYRAKARRTINLSKRNCRRSYVYPKSIVKLHWKKYELWSDALLALLHLYQPSGSRRHHHRATHRNGEHTRLNNLPQQLLGPLHWKCSSATRRTRRSTHSNSPQTIWSCTIRLSLWQNYRLPCVKLTTRLLALTTYTIKC